MKRGTKVSKSAAAKASFKSWDMAGMPEVKDKNGKVYHKMKGEKFVESPVLRKYGKNRYYISNRGHLIQFVNPTRPILKALDETDRERYVIFNAKTRKRDHYLVHRLVAEAFEVYAYGLATKDDDVHHRRRYKPDKSIAYNNNPKYLEYVTERVHKLLTYLQTRPQNERTMQEEREIMTALAFIAGTEEPDKITVLLDDPNDTAIFATDEIGLSLNARIQCSLLVNSWMCTAFLKTQHLESMIRYPVYCNIENGTEKAVAIAIYEFRPEEGRSVLVPCTAEEMKNQYDTAKEFTDSFIRGYQLLSQGYQ